MMVPVFRLGVHLQQNHAAALITTGTGLRSMLTLPLLDLSTLLKLALLVTAAGLAGHGAGVAPESV